MRYALNVADATRYDSIVRACMLAPVIQSRQLVECGKNPDDTGVVLECEDERAAAIIGCLRGYDSKLGQYPIRAYTPGSRGGWKKVR